MKWPFKYTIDAYLLRHRPEEYAISQAYYYYTGERLERELNKIKNKDVTYDINELNIDLKYNKISQYEYDIHLNNINNKDNDIEKNIGKLLIDFNYNKIDEVTYEKEVATIKQEPYMRVVDSEINYETNEFSYKPVWNSFFIDWLVKIGYSMNGVSEEEMVDTYMKDVFCSQVLQEIEHEMDDDDMEENLITSQSLRETVIKREVDSSSNKVIYS